MIPPVTKKYTNQSQPYPYLSHSESDIGLPASMTAMLAGANKLCWGAILKNTVLESIHLFSRYVDPLLIFLVAIHV
jgi:hypothetical protein